MVLQFFPLLPRRLTPSEQQCIPLSEYIEKVKAGEVQPHLKSEAAPEEPQEDPVKVVVGSTLEKMVFTEDKDVLLEVYAPWCGHCKKLAPVWEELGAKFAGSAGIVIAKMDATSNEHEEVDVRGFPAIKFWAHGEGKGGGVDYEGGRDLESFVGYLKQNHKSPDTAARHFEL